MINICSTYFGQDFPQTFRKREREKERTDWNKKAYVWRHDFRLTQFQRRDAFRFPALRHGCLSWRAGPVAQSRLNLGHYFVGRSHRVRRQPDGRPTTI